MLVVVMNNAKCSFPWEIYTKFTLAMIDIHSIIEVFADGNELQHIELNVSNIPIPRRSDNRGISWFGDHAKCVAGFLKIHNS